MSLSPWSLSNGRVQVTPGEPANDCAVQERELPFSVGLERYIVAQFSAQIVEVASYVGHGDQRPVAVFGGEFAPIDRGGLSRCGGADNAGHRCNCNHQESDPFHKLLRTQLIK